MWLSGLPSGVLCGEEEASVSGGLVFRSVLGLGHGTSPKDPHPATRSARLISAIRDLGTPPAVGAQGQCGRAGTRGGRERDGKVSGQLELYQLPSG